MKIVASDAVIYFRGTIGHRVDGSARTEQVLTTIMYTDILGGGPEHSDDGLIAVGCEQSR